MRFFHLLDSLAPFKKFINRGIEKRNEDILRVVLPHIRKSDSVLDLGSGTGHTAHSLIKRGIKVTCVDYSDMNIFEDTKPIIYDGLKIPFESKRFDVVLLVTVLHHTPNPEAIIKEAARVGRKIIVIEDTYNNTLQKWATFVMDSIGNLEFFGHPHTNKDDKGWRKVFKENGLKIENFESAKFFGIFESSRYVLKVE